MSPNSVHVAARGLGDVLCQLEHEDARETVTLRMPLKSLARRTLARTVAGELTDPAVDRLNLLRAGGLIHVIGLAFAWHQEMLAHNTTAEALAKRDGVSAAQVRRLLGLTHLAPDILRDALSNATTMSLSEALALGKTLSWQRQRERHAQRRTSCQSHS